MLPAISGIDSIKVVVMVVDLVNSIMAGVTLVVITILHCVVYGYRIIKLTIINVELSLADLVNSGYSFLQWWQRCPFELTGNSSSANVVQSLLLPMLLI